MKRPLAVTIIAWIYIAVGVVSFIYGFPLHAIHGDDILAESVRLSGIAAGVWMLRGANWARWLALAWIAFHVALSVFHQIGELAIHAVFFAVIALLLLRPSAAQYFRLGNDNSQ